MQILALEDRVEMLVAENRQLQEAKIRAEESLQNSVHQKHIDTRRKQEAVEESDWEGFRSEAQRFQAFAGEYERLTNVNGQPSGEKAHSIETNQTLTTGGDQAFQQWRSRSEELISSMKNNARGKITLTTADRDTETERLRHELQAAAEQIKTLQEQILTAKQTDSSLTIRDDNYFDRACQELYENVNQWVRRFSEISRTRACTLSSEIRDQELKVLLKKTTLDGSNVDTYLADRVKRRDVLMSVVMHMIGERVFASYLFGMGRMQREVLQALERNFYQVGK